MEYINLLISLMFAHCAPERSELFCSSWVVSLEWFIGPRRSCW